MEQGGVFSGPKKPHIILLKVLLKFTVLNNLSQSGFTPVFFCKPLLIMVM